MSKMLITIEVSMQDLWKHTAPRVERNKKKYYRKRKHKKNDDESRNAKSHKDYSYRRHK